MEERMIEELTKELYDLYERSRETQIEWEVREINASIEEVRANLKSLGAL